MPASRPPIHQSIHPHSQCCHSLGFLGFLLSHLGFFIFTQLQHRSQLRLHIRDVVRSSIATRSAVHGSQSTWTATVDDPQTTERLRRYLPELGVDHTVQNEINGKVNQHETVCKDKRRHVIVVSGTGDFHGVPEEAEDARGSYEDDEHDDEGDERRGDGVPRVLRLVGAALLLNLIRVTQSAYEADVTDGQDDQWNN